MRKILISTLIFAGVLVALPTFAVDYSRSPSGYTILNPVSFTAPVPTLGCGGTQTWNLLIEKTAGGEVWSDECFVASTTDGTFIKTLPISEYKRVRSVCYYFSDCTAEAVRTNLEYDGGATIFEVVEAPVAPVGLTIVNLGGDDFVSSIFAIVGDFFTDLKDILYLILGLILGVWVLYVVPSFFDHFGKRKS